MLSDCDQGVTNGATLELMLLDASPNEQLWEAVAVGDHEAMECALGAGANPSMFRIPREYPHDLKPKFEALAKWDRFESHHFDDDLAMARRGPSRISDFISVLMFAAQKHDTRAINILLMAGARVNAKQPSLLFADGWVCAYSVFEP